MKMDLWQHEYHYKVVVVNLDNLSKKNCDKGSWLNKIKNGNENLFVIHSSGISGAYGKFYYSFCFSGEYVKDSPFECSLSCDLYAEDIISFAPDGEYICMYYVFEPGDFNSGKTYVYKCKLKDGSVDTIYKQDIGWVKPDFEPQNLWMVCGIDKANKFRLADTKQIKLAIKPGRFQLEEGLRPDTKVGQLFKVTASELDISAYGVAEHHNFTGSSYVFIKADDSQYRTFHGYNEYNSDLNIVKLDLTGTAIGFITNDHNDIIEENVRVPIENGIVLYQDVVKDDQLFIIDDIEIGKRINRIPSKANKLNIKQGRLELEERLFL